MTAAPLLLLRRRTEAPLLLLRRRTEARQRVWVCRAWRPFTSVRRGAALPRHSLLALAHSQATPRHHTASIRRCDPSQPTSLPLPQATCCSCAGCKRPAAMRRGRMQHSRGQATAEAGTAPLAARPATRPAAFVVAHIAPWSLRVMRSCMVAVAAAVPGRAAGSGRRGRRPVARPLAAAAALAVWAVGCS